MVNEERLKKKFQKKIDHLSKLVIKMFDCAKNLAPLYQPIRSKTKTNCDLLAHSSCASHQLQLWLYLLQVLIGLLVCVSSDIASSVIISILV